VSAALDLILFERKGAIGNLRVAGPAVEVSQGRGNQASGDSPMRPIEVKSAFGRGGQVSGSIAGKLDLAIGVECAAGKAQAEQLADSRRAELVELGFQGVGGLVFGGGGGVILAGSVDATAEKRGIEGGHGGSVGKRMQGGYRLVKRDRAEDERICLDRAFQAGPGWSGLGAEALDERGKHGAPLMRAEERGLENGSVQRAELELKARRAGLGSFAMAGRVRLAVPFTGP
jgi:hypothetical protein